jgi:hypothetical protein
MRAMVLNKVHSATPADDELCVELSVQSPFFAFDRR